MIKFIVIDNHLAFPLSDIELIQKRRDSNGSECAEIVLAEGTNQERNILIAMPFMTLIQRLHGYQRSNDATFQVLHSPEYEAKIQNA